MSQVIYASHDQLLVAGGMAAVKITAEIIEEMSLTGVEIDEPVIMVHEYVRDNLSELQLRAMIAHEQGHIDAGHLDLEMPEADGPMGMVTMPSWELEADAAAAKTVGAFETLSTLQYVMNMLVNTDMLKPAFAQFGINDDQFRKVQQEIERQSVVTLEPRYAALRAML